MECQIIHHLYYINTLRYTIIKLVNEISKFIFKFLREVSNLNLLVIIYNNYKK